MRESITTHTTKHRPRRAAGRRTAGRAPAAGPAVFVDATATPDLVRLPARKVFAIDGHGYPGDQFGRALGALFGIAYTVRFARKAVGGGEFAVGPIEAYYWVEGGGRVSDVPHDRWSWQLRLPAPADLGARELAAAIEAATHKRGGSFEHSAEAAQVAMVKVPATRCARVLHVGPYATEAASFARIAELVAAEGLVASDAHSEIYLNDPRRVAPEKLRTVLLIEVAHPA